MAVGEAVLPGGRVGRDCICWQNMRRGNLVNCEMRSVAVLLLRVFPFADPQSVGGCIRTPGLERCQSGAYS